MNIVAIKIYQRFGPLTWRHFAQLHSRKNEYYFLFRSIRMQYKHFNQVLKEKELEDQNFLLEVK